jgi:hypothetical protein
MRHSVCAAKICTAMAFLAACSVSSWAGESGKAPAAAMAVLRGRIEKALADGKKVHVMAPFAGETARVEIVKIAGDKVTVRIFKFNDMETSILWASIEPSAVALGVRPALAREDGEGRLALLDVCAALGMKEAEEIGKELAASADEKVAARAKAILAGGGAANGVQHATPPAGGGTTAATAGPVAQVPIVSGASYYVAPNGAAGNSGSKDSPWDLASALEGKQKVPPGSTVWVRGGTYPVGGERSIGVSLAGAEGKPVMVRAVPGERATIDGGLVIGAAHLWLWGLEVTDSKVTRSGAGPGVNVYSGPKIRLINMAIHDTANSGVGFWTPATDGELYGTLIWHNGFQGPSRGHCHAIYTQNKDGHKRIVDNIMFNQFGWGIHIYTQQGFTWNYHVEGNIVFNNGCIQAGGGLTQNILVTGNNPKDPVVINNCTYFTPSAGGGSNRIFGTNATVKDNWFAGGSVGVAVNGLTASGNTCWCPVTGLPEGSKGAGSGLHVIVRPNQYEPGRANVCVYNWDKRGSVDIDLSKAGLKQGDKFEVRDAENFFGPAVASGTYEGRSVSIPMTGLKVAAAAGNVPTPPKHTAPEFGAFVVLNAGSAK